MPLSTCTVFRSVGSQAKSRRRGRAAATSSRFKSNSPIPRAKYICVSAIRKLRERRGEMHLDWGFHLWFGTHLAWECMSGCHHLGRLCSSPQAAAVPISSSTAKERRIWCIYVCVCNMWCRTYLFAYICFTDGGCDELFSQRVSECQRSQCLIDNSISTSQQKRVNVCRMSKSSRAGESHPCWRRCLKAEEGMCHCNAPSPLLAAMSGSWEEDLWIKVWKSLFCTTRVWREQ